jgi:hypothetical protein
MTPDDTLATIRSHPDFPFANWQSDDRSFFMTERYWSRLVRETIGPDASAWEPAFDTERDGNPILTIAHPIHRRALRVVLLTPSSNAMGAKGLSGGTGGDDPETPPHFLYAHLNIGRLADGETEVNELVISALTGAESETTARTLIHMHCVAFATPEAIEAAIDEDEHRFGLR